MEETTIDLKVKTCLSSYMLSDINKTVEVYQMTEKDFIIKVDGKQWETFRGSFPDALLHAGYIFRAEVIESRIALKAWAQEELNKIRNKDKQ